MNYILLCANLITDYVRSEMSFKVLDVNRARSNVFASKGLFALLIFVFISQNSYAESHVHSGKPDEVAMIQAQLNSDKNVRGAMDKLQSLLSKDPNNIEAHMMLGKIFQLLGFESMADDEFHKVDQLDPTKPTSVLNLFQNKLAAEGGMAAYEYLRYVERRFPNDPSVLLMEGMLARMRGELAKSEFFYKLALEKSPSTPGIYTAIAAVRLKQQRFKDALELAEKDLSLKKDHPAANLAKAQSLMALGDFERAIPPLRVAYIGVQDKRAVADLLSRALISNGEYSEAIEPTLVCMSLTPLNERDTIEQLKARIGIVLRHVKGSELLNSLQIASRYVLNSESLAALYFACGDVLVKARQYAAAEKCFEDGIPMAPYHGRPYLRLGILQEQKGDYSAALSSYSKAYQYNPDDREIAARLARLIKRAPIQDRDIAWYLKDLIRSGGRKSLVLSGAGISVKLQ